MGNAAAQKKKRKANQGPYLETRREFSDSKGQFKREHKKHALDVPLQKDLSLTKAQLEADQAVKQAERALKMARRAQREAKKNAEKSACAN